MHACCCIWSQIAGTNPCMHVQQVSLSDLSEPDDSDPLESESPSAPSTPWIHSLKDKNLCMYACMLEHTHITSIQAPASGRHAATWILRISGHRRRWGRLGCPDMAHSLPIPHTVIEMPAQWDANQVTWQSSRMNTPVSKWSSHATLLLCLRWLALDFTNWCLTQPLICLSAF